MSDDLTPEQVAQIGATGCATAWADYLWQHVLHDPLDRIEIVDIRDALAPLIEGLKSWRWQQQLAAKGEPQ
jgi:hypothetical protein